MKTNVVMTRKMGNFDIFQRTEDGMFNATSLLSQWNKKRGLSRGKEVNDFLKIDKTKEFINEQDVQRAVLQYLSSSPKYKSYYNIYIKSDKRIKNSIRLRLKKQIGETPPPELVEVKLLIIRTKRLCKTLKN